MIPGLERFHTPQSNSAGELQLLKPMCPEPVLCSKRSHHNVEPAYRQEEWPPLAATTEARRPQSLCSAAREAPTVRSLHTAKKSRPHSPPLEKSPSSSEDPAQPKINK